LSPEFLGRRALILAPLLLAACGFTPAYAPGGPGERLRDRIAVEAPETPEGFRLRARLEDRLGVARDGALVLTVELDGEIVAAAETPEGAITRYDLRGRARWRLLGASGEILAQGEATGFTGYSATGTAVATRSAEEDARERLVVLLADGIVARLLLLPPEALP
jgi:LPS-assembly lipoprotein